MNYAKYIDHTLLRADATSRDVKRLIEEAKNYGFYSVCVNPCYVKMCATNLKNTDINVCTVIGFPLGANDIRTKVFEVKNAIKNGADEIDVVINIGKLKEKKYAYIEKELASIKKVVTDSTVIKIILETCLLTDDEIVSVCKIACDNNIDFVKTSTGFSKSGASVTHVRLMKQACNGQVQVKASGGISTFESFKTLLEAGATRIGCSRSVEIMQEIK